MASTQVRITHEVRQTMPDGSSYAVTFDDAGDVMSSGGSAGSPGAPFLATNLTAAFWDGVAELLNDLLEMRARRRALAGGGS